MALTELSLARKNFPQNNREALDQVLQAAQSGKLLLLRDSLDVACSVFRIPEQQVSKYTDRLGRTPLHLAAAVGAVDGCRMLLEPPYECDPNTVDRNGLNVLLLAVQRRREEIVDLLFDHHAPSRRLNVNQRTKSGHTALSAAAAEGAVAVMEALLRRGARLSIPGRRKQRTPLFRAAENGQEEACWVLLLAGADPQRRDADGRTARQWLLSHRAWRERVAAIMPEEGGEGEQEGGSGQDADDGAGEDDDDHDDDEEEQRRWQACLDRLDHWEAMEPQQRRLITQGWRRRALRGTYLARRGVVLWRFAGNAGRRSARRRRRG